CMQSLDLPFTF
nr:immunoglobulin light chain junction region [Macaca mulatta]MOV82063.1 immunoglobulin light chain junction region [Macaca mulatta]MOV84249.1 immunoglobulin light chain junction region [Macaca mulatta]